MPERVRHLGRGTIYDVLGEGELQSSAGPLRLREGDRLTVYLGEDGKLWLRAPAEFEDGRFEEATGSVCAPDVLIELLRQIASNDWPEPDDHTMIDVIRNTMAEAVGALVRMRREVAAARQVGEMAATSGAFHARHAETTASRVESLRTMLAGALAFIAADVPLTDPDQVPGVVSTLDLATEKPVTFDAWAARRILEDTAAETFQGRVRHHLDKVTEGDPTDLDERRDRFGEEALELIQALGGTREGMLALVDYVWGRPAGEPAQEMGGALTTLAALASHADLDMAACGETELARTWTPEVFARIRRKRASRGGRGALPGVDGDVVTGGADARR